MVGSLGKLIDDWSKGVVNFTEHGKCSSCGQCCTNLLPMTKAEVAQIRRYIEKHGIKEHQHLAPFATPVVDMTCPFRNEETKKCDIYPIRPQICRSFLCSKPTAKLNDPVLNGERDVYDVRATFFNHKSILSEL